MFIFYMHNTTKRECSPTSLNNRRLNLIYLIFHFLLLPSLHYRCSSETSLRWWMFISSVLPLSPPPPPLSLCFLPSNSYLIQLNAAFNALSIPPLSQWMNTPEYSLLIRLSVRGTDHSDVFAKTDSAGLMERRRRSLTRVSHETFIRID